MRLKQLTLLILVLALTPIYIANAQNEDLPSFNGYKRDIQKAFAGEVAGKKNIALVSQSARILALMEFMEPSSYSEFYDCVKKYPDWEDLTATKREQVVDTCGRVARTAMVKSLGPSPASTTSPQQSLSPSSMVSDPRMTEIINRLKEIDQRITSIQENQKVLQDAIVATRPRTQRRPAGNDQIPPEDIIE